MQVHYVYMLELKLRNGRVKYYVGQTCDLEQRLRDHINGKCRSTKNKHPRLVYYERIYGPRKFAVRREKQLKKLSQAKKKELIKKFSSVYPKVS